MQQVILDRFYINNITGQSSFVFSDLINQSLRFNNQCTKGNYDDYITPFIEVGNMVPDLSKINPKLLRQQRIDELNPITVIDLFYHRIYEAWDTNKLNLVFCSSGLDSRLYSLLIKRVHLERGGRVHFVCMWPEEEYFKQLMSYIGFDSFSYTTLGYEDVYNFDFRNTWRQTGTVNHIPHNRIPTAIQSLKNIGIIYKHLLKII
jgi:hypothetical protein